MEVPLAICISLAQALRNGDAEMFLEQYDTLLGRLDHSIQLTTAKECARQISELPKDEFTLLQRFDRTHTTNDHTHISTDESVVVQLSVILEELSYEDDSGAVSDLESGTVTAELFSDCSSTHLIDEHAQPDHQDTPTSATDRLTNQTSERDLISCVSVESISEPDRANQHPSTTRPPETEMTRPPETEVTRPPETETTSPPETETTSPPETETTSPPETETTRPPETETTSPPETETTRPPETTTEHSTESIPVCTTITKTCRRIKQSSHANQRRYTSPADLYLKTRSTDHVGGQGRRTHDRRRGGWRKGGGWRGRGQYRHTGGAWRDPPITYNHAEVAAYLLKGWQTAQKELMSMQ